MTQLYGDIFSFTNTFAQTYISTNVATVANLIAPAVTALLSLYVILWGVASMRGMIQEPITEAASRIVKIVLICYVALQLGHYNELIVDTFVMGPEELAKHLSGATSSSGTISGLDKILDAGFATGKNFWEKGGFMSGDPGMYIIAIVVWGVVIAVTAYSCFLIVLAKIALSLVIGLGPLFIVSLLFQRTAQFFSSWIQQLSNYGLLIILVFAANVFISTLFAAAATGAAALSSTTQIDQIFPVVIIGVVSVLVLAQLRSISAGLAGGLSLSSEGMGHLGLSVLSGSAGRAGSLARTGMGKIPLPKPRVPTPGPRRIPRNPSQIQYENRDNHIGPA